LCIEMVQELGRSRSYEHRRGRLFVKTPNTAGGRQGA
jgi:hypothetical protein